MEAKAIFWVERAVWGYKKCPQWLKNLYFKAVLNTCQECNKQNIPLTPHRIIRGNAGGLYTVCSIFDKRNNIKVVCERCHKKLHSKEPGCLSK